MACSPGISRPLQPRAGSLFLSPLPLFVCPPFSAINVASIPYNPCGCSLLGSAFLRHVLEPPPPPLSASTCVPVPSGPEEGRVSSPWPTVPLCRSSSSTALLPPHISVSSGGLSSSGRPFARWQEARASPLPSNFPTQTLSLRYSAVPAPCQRRQAACPPPLYS